jgi:uncharacterized protein (DUF433 family)
MDWLEEAFPHALGAFFGALASFSLYLLTSRLDRVHTAQTRHHRALVGLERILNNTDVRRANDDIEQNNEAYSRIRDGEIESGEDIRRFNLERVATRYGEFSRLLSAVNEEVIQALARVRVAQPRDKPTLRWGVPRWSVHVFDCARMPRGGIAMTLTRITVNPGVCSGKPCIRGLRFPVSRLLGLLAAGETVESILRSYPDLEREDIHQALHYAALLADEQVIDLAS